MKNIVFKGIVLLVIFSGCSSSKKYMNYRYKFSDSNFRNILISFRQDSSFLLLNSVSGSLSYSFVGRWQQIDDHTMLLTNPHIDPISFKAADNAPKLGEKIDAKRASEDHSYIFPVIQLDSIFFTSRFNGFVLKGYNFRRASRIKDR
jgi:hypothetical protein